MLCTGGEPYTTCSGQGGRLSNTKHVFGPAICCTSTDKHIWCSVYSGMTGMQHPLGVWVKEDDVVTAAERWHICEVIHTVPAETKPAGGYPALVKPTCNQPWPAVPHHGGLCRTSRCRDTPFRCATGQVAACRL